MSAATLETAVRERPILFSAPMVRAILDGRKTQTRRVVTPQPVYYATLPPELPRCPAQHEKPGWWWTRRDGTGIHSQRDEAALRETFSRSLGWCPHGQPGERLWVRETWTADCEWPTEDGDEMRWWHEQPAGFRGRESARCLYYAADRVAYTTEEDGPLLSGWQPSESDWEGVRWQPSIHMPRWASRLTLEVTGVRVERVQDISEAHAEAEGVFALPDAMRQDAARSAAGRGETAVGPLDYFRELWDSLNAARGYGWSANPWVWVIEFRRLP